VKQIELCLKVCGVMLGLAGIAVGQETPKIDIFGGFSYLRVHSGEVPTDNALNGILPVSHRNVNFNMAGWNGSATENLNYWFGGEFDARGAYSSPTFTYPGLPVSTTPVLTKIHAFTYGPRFSFRRIPRVVPYAHILLGAAILDATTNQSGTSASTAALAVIPGIGLDVNVSQRLAIRLFQLDYMMTRFYNQRQDNAAVSAGFVLHFGNK
jgi:hypothetical protein